MATAVRRGPPARRASAEPAAAPRRAARGETTSHFHRGAEGMARADEEIAKAKQRAAQRREQQGKPFRFRVPIGETRQVVVLDDKPDFFMYEHNLKGPEGFYNVFHGCTKETDNCPICESSGKESYYALFLSVIDLTPYENRKGDVVDFSRKLFVVKNQQQKKFMRWYEKEGSLRGLILDCTRDGDKEPAIGNDIEIVETMPEEEMQTYVRSFKNQEGKTVTEDCSEPYEYEKLFEEPDSAKLRAAVGGRATPGSREADASELGGRTRRAATADDGWESPEAEGNYARESAAPAGRRAPPARRGAAPAEAPTRVSRTRPAPPPADADVANGWTEADLQEGEYLDDDGNIVNETGDILAPADEAPLPTDENAADQAAQEAEAEAQAAAERPRRAPVRTAREAPAAPARRTRAAPAAAEPASPRRHAPPATRTAPPRRAPAGRRPIEDDDIPFEGGAATQERAAPPRRVSFRGKK